jgi:RNA polymerase sigma-70 factor, ECF subfamily
MDKLTSEQLTELTRRISTSDREAFDQLFRALYAPLVRYSYRYLKEKASAADIVQDAFIKLWHKRELLDPEQSIKAYLYKTVRNLSLNHIRNRSFEESGLEYEDIPAAEISVDSDQDDVKTDRLNLLKDWIMKLPERQQEAFKLSRYEGLDHEEIAEVMEVSKRTVNNHIVQAMKNIQSFYDDYKSEMNTVGYGRKILE